MGAASPDAEPVVLVVDDERVIREGCVRVCESLRCRPIAVEDGEGALEAMEMECVDVLLLDLMMPGVSGMEILGQVRERSPEVVVIVITGYATVELAVEAMKKGAYDFVPKPFTPDQLRLVVNRALERRRLQREAERLREERARSLRDVAEEKSRLRTIIHAMADGVLVTDQEGVIVLDNPPAGRLLGCGETPLLHRHVDEVTPPEIGQMVHHLMREPPGTTRCVEVSVGGVGEIRAHGGPVHLPAAGVLGSVTVIQDITPLKEMDRMKSDFVSMVSHELRSPLAAIQQQLSVIDQGMAGSVTDRQRSLLTRAQQRVRGLMNLINDLLDLARIEAGCVVARGEPLQLESVVGRVVEHYGELARQRGLRMIQEPFPSLPPVVGDQEALEAVFTNLVSNAIAYTPAGKEIRLRGGTRGSYVWVEVVDEGVGIPQEAIPKIFDRFYRVKEERTRQVVGTGLGLPIVKGIVEAHLGVVEVESQPGRGATFRVLLPEAPAPVDASGPAPG